MGKAFDFLHATNEVLTARGISYPWKANPRTVAQRRIEELEEMLGERAGAIHEVKDEGRQDLGQRHAWGLAAALGNGGQSRAARQLLNGGQKTVRRIGWRGMVGSLYARARGALVLRAFSHSQRK